MNIEDVPMLNLKEHWMYDRFREYFERDIGPAFIVEEDGRAMCAFGVLFDWGGSGACEAWFNLLDNKRAFNIVRILKRQISALAAEHGITRMQAIVECDSKTNNRFMDFLGFVNETPNGMKSKLHDGRDAYLYSRIF